MADFKIKSTAGTGNKLLIQSENQSGSDYAIEVGSSGALGSLKPSSIKTTTNSYDAIKVGELNSKGYVMHNFFGMSYYLGGGNVALPNATWTEVTTNWTKYTSGSSGGDDADLFAKFSGGRFTPTIAGFYQVNVNTYHDGIDDTEFAQAQIRRNGSSSAGDYIGQIVNHASTASQDVVLSLSGIIPLDTNDYISLWCYHNEGGASNAISNQTQFSVTYVGTSDL